MFDCPKCVKTDPHVHSEDLSAQEHYALWYALAVTFGADSKYDRIFKEGDARLTNSARDKKAMLQNGLARLHEKGLVSLARNGLGEYEPAQVHLDRYVGGNLIIGDRA